VNTFRVLQVSDTHLSRAKPWFVPNFEAVVGLVASRAPDLVVNTGDIALDGATGEDDLAWARECHAALGVPFRAVPGNHDVGDNPWRPEVDQPITDEPRARYRRHFADDYWLTDIATWVLVGVNAQLLGSGRDAEDEQWSFLASVADQAAGRPVALFIHKPLFDRDPGEADINQRYVIPVSRRRLAEVLRDVRLRLVASGHVHQHRRHRLDGVEHCWAPSTAYIIPDRIQPTLGSKRVGYVEHTFHAAHVETTIVEAPELTNHNLNDFPLAYSH
jgi:3',5'-cyclic-AMP phosphodiesterase